MLLFKQRISPIDNDWGDYVIPYYTHIAITKI